jgi:hypothetical protein
MASGECAKELLQKGMKEIDVLLSHQNHKNNISYIRSIISLKNYLW